MPGKSKIETPPPSMNDVIRNRAYELWGVHPQPAAESKGAAGAKTAKKAAKKTSKPKAGKAKKH